MVKCTWKMQEFGVTWKYNRHMVEWGMHVLYNRGQRIGKGPCMVWKALMGRPKERGEE